jgi:hypothetical protein
VGVLTLGIKGAHRRPIATGAIRISRRTCVHMYTAAVKVTIKDVPALAHRPSSFLRPNRIPKWTNSGGQVNPSRVMVVKRPSAALIIESMSFVALIRSAFDILRDLAVDAVSFAGSSLRSLTALLAENLFLRKQLAFYQESGIRPRRLTNAARLLMVLSSRFFDWKSALIVVKPATLIGWHRRAFRLFWKLKSRPGRRRIPPDLRQLIVDMVRDNPIRGEERIAHELWLKLGIRVSPRTVRAYWPSKGPWSHRNSQRWNSFVHNHARGRPHSSLGPGIPDQRSAPPDREHRHCFDDEERVTSTAWLVGLHHEYAIERPAA